MKKVFIILALLLICVLCACGGGETSIRYITNEKGEVVGTEIITENQDIGAGVEEKVDNAKTQLYVSNFNGGYGDEWLQKIKKRFEDLYKDTSFEEGKMGVQVLIDNAKITGTNLIGNISVSRNQVFFTEGVSYQEYVGSNLVLDITDIVTEDLTKYGENKSIEDKFSDFQKESLSIGGKYYMIPHYEGYCGITIDCDLFNAKKLFMGADGKFQYTQSSENLSNGPDGVKGTYDDGLPATYQDFYNLCKDMVKRGVTPFTWSGQYQFYVSNLLSALAVDDMGVEEGNIGLNFEGKSNTIVDTLNPDGSYTLKSVDITEANGYEVMNQVGYYNGMKFIEEIIKNEWYSNTSFLNAQTHTDCQDDYLLSSKDSALKPIGMIVDGIWWPNEARDTFKEMSVAYEKAGIYDRNFMFIPLPKASQDKVGSKNTLLEYILSYGFINANIDEQYIPLAKLFLQFCNTDESLVEFTTTTSTPKALNYEMSEIDMYKLTPFGRSVMQMKNNENTDILHTVSKSQIYWGNTTIISLTNRYTIDQYANYSTAVKNNGVNAYNYFNSFRDYWKKVWETRFKSIYDK